MRIRIKQTAAFELKIGLVYTIIGVIGFFIARYYTNIFTFVPPCLFRHLTGIPCPACGALHSGYYLAHFKILPALTANPFFFFLYTGLLFLAGNTLAGYIFKKNLHFLYSEQEYRLVRIFIIISLPLNWIYLIVAQYMNGTN